MNQQLLEFRNQQIAKEHVEGKSVKQLGEEFALSPQSVSKVLKKPKSREIIESETKKLLGLVPEITEQLAADLKLGTRLTNMMVRPESEPELLADSCFRDTKDVMDFLKLNYKKQQDIMKAMGIFPSNSTNVFIQQIYNDNRKQVLSPEVFKALGGIFSSPEDQTEDETNQVEDAEIIDVQPTNPEDADENDEEAV
jgi:hypothetical protein